MTTQNKTAFAAQNPSRWHRLMARLATFEQSMTFNPHEYTNANVNHLRHKIEILETRVNELEGRDQQVA